ncbi:hypothetical protein [Rhizorhapis sp. SPR117]|uniref:hypothetical protein n=1 Tax=Rhizorhapis sp. SPR117 TaxID=2912611 RepID=UPI001F23F315|nr:hypothetical protein [Rhizorhapis sp. SPR117]
MAVCPRVLANASNGRPTSFKPLWWIPEAPLGFDTDGTDYGLIHLTGVAVPDDVTALIDWLIAQPE